MKRFIAIVVAFFFLAIILIPVLYELDQENHKIQYSAMYEYYGRQIIHSGTTDDRDPQCAPAIGYGMELIEGSCEIAFK